MSNRKLPEVFKPEDFAGIAITTWHVMCDYVAERANRILAERGTVVYGCKPPGEVDVIYFPTNNSQDTHTALILDIQPIVEDTAEDILRDLSAIADDVLRYDDSVMSNGDWDKLHAQVKRARRHLEKRGKS